MPADRRPPPLRRWRAVASPLGAVVVALGVVGLLLLANHHTRWVPSIAVPPPPTAAPVENLAAPLPNPVPASIAPFSQIHSVAGAALPGFGGLPAGVPPVAGVASTTVRLVNGRVAGITLAFPPGTRFFTVLGLLTKYLPNDARMDINQLQDKSCRQVQYRSLVLAETVEVPAVLIELTSLRVTTKKAKTGPPPFRYDAVASATFTVSAIGDRSRHCAPAA